MFTLNSSELFTGTSFVTYIIYNTNIVKFVKFVNYYLYSSDIIIRYFILLANSRLFLLYIIM